MILTVASAAAPASTVVIFSAVASTTAPAATVRGYLFGGGIAHQQYGAYEMEVFAGQRMVEIHDDDFVFYLYNGAV